MKFVLLFLLTFTTVAAPAATYCSSQIGGISMKAVHWVIHRVCEIDDKEIIVELKDKSKCGRQVSGNEACLTDMPPARYAILRRTPINSYVFAGGQKIERDELLVQDLTNNRVDTLTESKTPGGEPLHLSGELADYSVTVYYLHR